MSRPVSTESPRSVSSSSAHSDLSIDYDDDDDDVSSSPKSARLSSSSIGSPKGLVKPGKLSFGINRLLDPNSIVNEKHDYHLNHHLNGSPFECQSKCSQCPSMMNNSINTFPKSQFTSSGHSSGGHRLTMNPYEMAMNHLTSLNHGTGASSVIKVVAHRPPSIPTPAHCKSVSYPWLGSMGFTTRNHNLQSNQPFICPLCSVSLDGIDINNHFYEEVHKVETLRKLNNWAKECNGTTDSRGNVNDPNGKFDNRTSSFHSNGEKKMPYSRWETFQRVKQNRHSRLTALVRQTKRRFQIEDLRSGALMQQHRERQQHQHGHLNQHQHGHLNQRQRHCHERIWNNMALINTRSESSHLESQKQEDDSDNDSDSEKNVDVVSDSGNEINQNDKDSELGEDRSTDNCTPEYKHHHNNQHDQHHQTLTDSNINGDNNHNNHSDNVNVKTPRKLTDGNGIEPLENGLSSASESEIIIVNRNSPNRMSQ